MNIIY